MREPLNDIQLEAFLPLLKKAHKYENYVAACCCFHEDKMPSLFIYKDRYFCRSCGKTGKTKNLLKHLNNIEATVGPEYNDQDFYNPWSRWLRRQSLKTIVEHACKRQSVYMRSRGIPDHVQRQLMIGLRDNWVIIPIIDRNRRLEGALARAGEGNNSPVRYYAPAGQSPNLIYAPSWKRIEKADRVYLTFGTIDAMSLYVLGLAAISTVAGKQVDPAALNSIRKEIHIIPDFGEEEDAIRLAKSLGWRGKICRLRYDQAKDVNDLLMKDRTDLEEQLRCR